jgi:hypothetical protein
VHETLNSIRSIAMGLSNIDWIAFFSPPPLSLSLSLSL